MPADSRDIVPREAGEWAMSLPGNHFQRGAQACREMMARFVEATQPEIAQSIRLNWHPGWGADPGRPPEVVATWEPEPCPAGEAARAALEANDEAAEGDLELTARMLETWGPVVEPASPDGKVSFTRAMMDSAATAIRRALSASPARGEGEEPCPVCGCEERTGAGYLQCECPAPATTSTAEQAGAALAPYLEDLKGIREEMAKPDAPSPGEGDAPVAWPSKAERDRAAQAVCGANAIMGREPLSEGASYTFADVVLREVAPPKAVVIENTPEKGGEAHCVDNAVDARDILAGGYDARARRVARAFLALAAAQAEKLVSANTSQTACSESSP